MISYLSNSIIFAIFIQLIHTINFPYQSAMLSVYNTNNLTYFNASYYLMFAKTQSPLIITAINTFYINSTFKGHIIPTLFTNQSTAYDMVQLQVVGSGWNTSVPQLFVTVALLQVNPTSYESVYVNITEKNLSVSVNSYWNTTNCVVVMYLLGWHNIINTKFSVCYINGTGSLFCSNSKYSTTSSYVYYNVVIYSNAWLAQNCPNCLIGGINATTSYAPLMKLDPNGSYNYFSGFNYFGSTNQWVGAFELPTMFSLASGTNSYDSGIVVVSFPATPTNVTPKISTPPPIPKALPTALIIGVVVGGTLFFLLILLIYIYSKKRFYQQELERINKMN
jgi:hypothetical protein